MNPRTSLRLLLALLAASLMLGCPTRGGSRGGGGGDDDDDDSAVGDDDDTVSDDDDSTPVGDDDDSTPVGDDDDSTPVGDDDDSTGSGPCPAGASVVNEAEPNDETKQPQDLGSLSGTVCINGSVTCGAGDDYDDLDFLQFTAGPGEVTLSLYWSTSADMDVYLWSPGLQKVLINYEEGFASSESDSATLVAGDYVIQVACWEGTGGAYTAVLEL